MPLSQRNLVETQPKLQLYITWHSNNGMFALCVPNLVLCVPNLQAVSVPNLKLVGIPNPQTLAYPISTVGVPNLKLLHT